MNLECDVNLGCHMAPFTQYGAVEDEGKWTSYQLLIRSSAWTPRPWTRLGWSNHTNLYLLEKSRPHILQQPEQSPSDRSHPSRVECGPTEIYTVRDGQTDPDSVHRTAAWALHRTPGSILRPKNCSLLLHMGLVGLPRISHFPWA